MSGALSTAYFVGVSHYNHATVVDGASGRNLPYYMPSDWYAAIGRKCAQSAFNGDFGENKKWAAFLF